MHYWMVGNFNDYSEYPYPQPLSPFHPFPPPQKVAEYFSGYDLDLLVIKICTVQNMNKSEKCA